MGVLTVCLTCWLIFVAEITGEEPGQVVLTRIQPKYFVKRAEKITEPSDLDLILSQGRNNPGMLHTHFTRFGSITGRTEPVDPGRGQGSGVAEYFTR